MTTIRKGTQVKLTPEIMIRIVAHANEACDNYRTGDRSKQTKMSDIIRGKMAEYGYYLMCKNEGIEISDTDLVNHINGDDGGHDFKVNKITVNVKSLDAAKRGYYQVPIPDLRAEAYVLCWVDVYNKIIIYEGTITRNKIQLEELFEEGKNPTTGKPYRYVHKMHLSELDENFE